jgi:hypothetical protein
MPKSYNEDLLSLEDLLERFASRGYTLEEVEAMTLISHSTTNSKGLLICLDYDKTYDRAPPLWDGFIELCSFLGHTVILATYRDERMDNTDLLLDLSKRIPVYYTRGVAKKWWIEQFAEEAHAHPDIWIDDNPQAIFENSRLSREGLIKWREEQKGNLPHGFVADSHGA